MDGLLIMVGLVVLVVAAGLWGIDSRDRGLGLPGPHRPDTWW